MNRDEALRLAEIWEDYLPAYNYKQVALDTADELRRLHAENEKFRKHIESQNDELDKLIPMAEKLEAQRDALLEAAREGLSVCRSVSISHDRRIKRDGSVLYAQTEEWCRWVEDEVGPKIEAAIAAVEGEGK